MGSSATRQAKANSFDLLALSQSICNLEITLASVASPLFSSSPLRSLVFPFGYRCPTVPSFGRLRSLDLQVADFRLQFTRPRELSGS